jgi:phosphate transport system protein
MREVYHQQLETLREHVLEMAQLARGMLQDGVDALVRLDVDLAADVDSRKAKLAELDDNIESESLKIAHQQQPMAKDLRAIAAALKLITYINRVGRYGKDIAQITMQWGDKGHIAKLTAIPHMAEILLKMFDTVMDAYRAQSRFDVAAFTDWEDTLDAARYATFRECLSYMTESPANIERGSHYMMIARYLERAGDNVCKMAEKTHYMVTGERITIR